MEGGEMVILKKVWGYIVVVGIVIGLLMLFALSQGIMAVLFGD